MSEKERFVLTKYYGETAQARVVSVLASTPPGGLNATEIAEEADISRRTAHYVITALEEIGMVGVMRTEGNSKYYSLADHPASVAAIKLVQDHD